MTLGVSVVICCHNSAKRLPETLRHLAAQQVAASIPWEVVVINNASTDDTATVAMANWPAPPLAPLRVIAEPQAGLHHARVRGIHEVRHEIISFIDDDNWVTPNWVSRVESIFAAHSEVGACGGKSDAVTAIDPPPWFGPIKGHYAVGSQFAHNGDVTHTLGTLLWGAGLNLRTAAVRQVLQEGFTFRLSGRKGNRLLAGEDTELCFVLRAAGWLFWYEDDLALSHYIPVDRLTWTYARRLLRGMGSASALMDLYLLALRCPPFDAYPSWKQTWIFQYLKSLRSWLVTIFFHPIDSLFQPEGSPVALASEKINGKLAMLWQMRNNYGSTRNLIIKSIWNSQKK